MGVFNSNCPNCKASILWFLHTPKDYKCEECGESVSEKEIEDSWHKNYRDHLIKIGYIKELDKPEEI
jgi:tRNA(Ile2) C34 agmatinyltransferase TiaS